VKRWLVRICLFLLLGAIVNVAVAWGWVAWSEASTAWQLDRPRVSAILVAGGFDVLPDDRCEGGISAGRGLHIRTIILDAMEQNGISNWSVEFLAGLPCHSLHAEWRASGTTTNEMYDFKPSGGIQHKRLKFEEESFDRLLPLHPIWPGFAINTVFYAALLWLLFAAPFALRRWRRVKRGLCARCGYPWGVGAVCSECGSAIVRRRTAVHGAPPPATPGPQSNVDQNA
jgi:hypothetical protein